MTPRKSTTPALLAACQAMCCEDGCYDPTNCEAVKHGKYEAPARLCISGLIDPLCAAAPTPGAALAIRNALEGAMK